MEERNDKDSPGEDAPASPGAAPGSAADSAGPAGDSLYAVEECADEGTWLRHDLVVDSGAAVSAMPLSESQGLEVTPTNNGESYHDASGNAVERRGTVFPTLYFQDGAAMTATMEAMAVRRPLLSVSQAVAAGNTFVFHRSPDGTGDSYSGARHRVYVRNGIYTLPSWRF